MRVRQSGVWQLCPSAVALLASQLPLPASQAQCAAEVEQRERLSADYLALLVELRAVRAAMSAAPSRAETRQEQHAVGAGPSQPHERHMQAGPSPSWQHGQLLEPEEEEEEARWLQAAAGPWEQPRHAPVPAPLPRRG